jgi:glyoxylase-like metal-dependent hydrolase (beta-lactamase superfamily II)
MDRGAVRERSGHAPPTEVVAGRVFRLGGALERDGRLSWVAPDARGYEPMNCYLLLGGAGALLIDTGAGVHAEVIVAQLRELLPADAKLSLLLTRTEMDCPLNVPAIEAAFDVAIVRFTGGVTVPRGVANASVERFNVADGETITLEAAPGIELEICTPRLKLLPTLWPYDPVSRTLFTSDAFNYEAWDAPDGDVLLSGDAAQHPDSVRSSLLAKFFYFSRADTGPIADDLRVIFDRWDVATIAPTHGRVIAGRDMVARHVDVLERVLREVGR